MGPDTSITPLPQQSPAERIQQEIRRTEMEISETVHTLEEKLSPKNLRNEAWTKTRHYALLGTSKLLDLIQRKPVPSAVIGTGAVLFLMRRMKSGRKKEKTPVGAAGTFVGSAARPAGKKTARGEKSMIRRGIATALGTALGTFLYNRQASRPRRAEKGSSDIVRETSDRYQPEPAVK